MNWTRVVIGGLVAGIVVNLADFVMHGKIMADTYKRFDQVFTQAEANPMLFFAVAMATGVMVAMLFAKTRAAWAPGWKGGLFFGLFFGLATFFLNFYNPLVIDGFPYYLSWCWGGIGVIDGLIGGTVLGLIIPRE